MRNFKGFAIDWDKICYGSLPYVPYSKYDLLRILQALRTSHVKQSFKLYNDYKRFNLTHFWSDIANTWWSNTNETQQMNYDQYNSVSYRKYYLTFRKRSQQNVQLSILYESYDMTHNKLTILTKGCCCM